MKSNPFISFSSESTALQRVLWLAVFTCFAIQIAAAAIIFIIAVGTQLGVWPRPDWIDFYWLTQWGDYAATLYFGVCIHVIWLMFCNSNPAKADYEPSWPMYWLVFLFLGFPFTTIIALILKVCALNERLPARLPCRHRMLGDTHNFIIPLLVFCIGGTVWWYFLPNALRALLK